MGVFFYEYEHLIKQKKILLLFVGRLMDIEYNNINKKLFVKQTLFYNQIIYDLWDDDL